MSSQVEPPQSSGRRASKPDRGRRVQGGRTRETPSKRRRTQHREEVRRAILDASEALLVEAGHEGFSMRRLAARCGYTAPTIYSHFGDKGRLIDAVLEAGFARLLARFDALPRQRDPEQTLRGMFAAFERFGLDNPTFYRLLEVPRENGSEPPESAERARARIEESLRELADANRLETDDLELALQSIWVMLHGIVSMRINRPDYEWSPQLDDFALDTLLRGLVRPAPRRRGNADSGESGRGNAASGPQRRDKGEGRP